MKKQASGKRLKQVLGISSLILYILFFYVFSSQNGAASNKLTSDILAFLKGKPASAFSPGYLKLEKKGDLLTGYYSYLGVLWMKLDRSVEMKLGEEYYVGLTVNSRNSKALCSAQFDKLVLSQGRTKINTGDWSSADIGKVQVKGSSQLQDGAWTLKGSGNDLYRKPEGSHFLYRKMSGDFSMTVRVLHIDNTNYWARAGLVVRPSLEPDQYLAGVTLIPSNYAGFWGRGQGFGSISPVNYPVGFSNHLFRKVLHFLGYFFLAFIVYFALSQYHISMAKKLLLAFLFCIAAAVLDEGHQIFVAGRNSQLADILIDSSGAFLGILIRTVLFFLNPFKKRSKMV